MTYTIRLTETQEITKIFNIEADSDERARETAISLHLDNDQSEIDHYVMRTIVVKVVSYDSPMIDEQDKDAEEKN